MIKKIALTLGLLGALALVAPVQAATQDAASTKTTTTGQTMKHLQEHHNNVAKGQGHDIRVIHYQRHSKNCLNRCMWRGHSRHHCHRICHYR
ncbi:hypothetical protein BH10PSE19_BH10PSE19_17970 [soil metagenome]